MTPVRVGKAWYSKFPCFLEWKKYKTSKVNIALTSEKNQLKIGEEHFNDVPPKRRVDEEQKPCPKYPRSVGDELVSEVFAKVSMKCSGLETF